MAGVHATSLGHLWQEVITAEPLPPRLLILGTAVAALILVGWRRAWPLSRTVVTIAHEGGHALVALAAARRVRGERLGSRHRGHRRGRVPVSPAPGAGRGRPAGHRVPGGGPAPQPGAAGRADPDGPQRLRD